MIRPVRTVDKTDCLDRLPYNDIMLTVLQFFLYLVGVTLYFSDFILYDIILYGIEF